MYCYRCGEPIDNNASVCPFCGAVQFSHTAAAEQTGSQYDLMCVIGFALACISLLFNPYGIFAVAGIVLSIIGLVNAKKKNEKGRIFAVLGIVIGAAALIYMSVRINKVLDYTMSLFDGTLGLFGDFF